MPDKRFQISEAVQKHEVLLLVQQLLAVMLAVDVQQASAQRLQLSHRHGTAVYPAGALAVAADLALQQQRAVLLRRNAQLLCGGAIPENTALTNALSAPVRISSRLVRCPARR